jgi:hypothetical protein
MPDDVWEDIESDVFEDILTDVWQDLEADTGGATKNQNIKGLLLYVYQP